MKQKIISLFAAFIMLFMFFPTLNTYAAQSITNSTTGTQDGYNYELWKDHGNTSMTLNQGGTFSCQWNNIGNALFRKGKKFDCTKTYKQLGNISVDYSCTYNPSGNSYLCVYGWTKSPLVEYYIVDSWGSWRPPGASSKGTITVDGGTYDIYETTRVNQPSIEGTKTFKQYWSVRRSKRTSGIISVSKHFEEWEKRGMKLGNLYETALTVEGYQSSGTANVYKNNISVGGSYNPNNNNNNNNNNGNSNNGAFADGWYYIKNVNAQKYLQVKDNLGKALQNVELGKGTGVKGQKWYLKNTGDGYITLKSALGDFMLDVNRNENKDGTNVQIYNSKSNDSQKFAIKKSTNNKAYIITTKSSNGTKALDDYNFETYDGANVCQWTYGGNANQQWIFEKTNN